MAHVDTVLERRIERLTDALHSFGYAVMAEPIEGQEEVFAAHLKEALTKVEERSRYLRRAYALRGKSKNLFSRLHASLPSPAWGVEVRQPVTASRPYALEQVW